MPGAAAIPGVGRQHCPTCDAAAAKAVTLTLAYVYLRCERSAVKCGSSPNVARCHASQPVPDASHAEAARA